MMCVSIRISNSNETDTHANTTTTTFHIALLFSVAAVALAYDLAPLRVVGNDASLAVVHLRCQHSILIAGCDGRASILSLTLLLVRPACIIRSIIILRVSSFSNLALVADARRHLAYHLLFTRVIRKGHT